MRAIKYRAWHWNRKRMLQVGSIDWTRNTICGTWMGDPPGPTGELGLDACELMQFTGLVDHNGQDIYEGDLVEAVHGRIGVEQPVVSVRWNAAAARFLLYDVDSTPVIDFLEAFAVIGNIHENRNLYRNA